MMKIDSYQSGEIVIEGRRYTSDLIIFPHRVESNWWRMRGHQLLPQDLEEVVRQRPEMIIVGTGESDRMKVLPETKQYVQQQGIELIAQATDQACQTYNQLCSSRKVVGVFHLAC